VERTARHIVPIPSAAVKRLEDAGQQGPGYQFVSVKLKDGRVFEQAVVSEGCIIQVKGQRRIPFTENDVESVEITDRIWNFRRRRDGITPQSDQRKKP